VSIEEALRTRLLAEGWQAASWGNGPGDRYGAHDHPYDKVLVVADGSIRFGLPDRGETADLSVGDRLDLPAQTRHDAVVGPSGVTCLEAHAPAGTVGVVRRRPAGDW
jgi:quercetin dioxygenase-like cupin family protein